MLDISISIIVVAHNSARYLRACLASILAQAGPATEVIVVDNASTDGSADLVATEFPRVRLLRGANTGYAGGNNLGAAQAQGSLLVFLNPDTVLHAGALAALVAPLQAGTTVALTTPCIVYARRPEVINACGNTMHFTGLTYCRGAGRPRAAYAQSCLVDAVSGAAFAVRRAVFVALGGFDDAFFMYVEDTDLSLRARLAGYQCLYVADAVVAHDYQPAYSPTKAFYLDRNRHLMLRKNIGRAAYRRSLPGLIVSELVTWGYLLLKGPRYWSVKPRVYRWLWRHRRPLRRVPSSLEPYVLGQMTYRLDFAQLAPRRLAHVAGAALHPVFWAMRLLLPGVQL